LWKNAALGWRYSILHRVHVEYKEYIQDK